MSAEIFVEVQLGVKPEKEEHAAFATKPGHVTQMNHSWDSRSGRRYRARQQ